MVAEVEVEAAVAEVASVAVAGVVEVAAVAEAVASGAVAVAAEEAAVSSANSLRRAFSLWVTYSTY